jgi:hypothetical protein
LRTCVCQPRQRHSPQVLQQRPLQHLPHKNNCSSTRSYRPADLTITSSQVKPTRCQHKHSMRITRTMTNSSV